MEEVKKNAQTEANKRWQEKNKERAKYISDRSRSRNFLKKRIEVEDIAEFEELIRARKEELGI
ncbi:MAG: hypothetical protein Q4B63_07960 [Clostridium perfringens]|nr:hypothetical protein [Clostridium perfringens]